MGILLLLRANQLILFWDKFLLMFFNIIRIALFFVIQSVRTWIRLILNYPSFFFLILLITFLLRLNFYIFFGYFYFYLLPFFFRIWINNLNLFYISIWVIAHKIISFWIWILFLISLLFIFMKRQSSFFNFRMIKRNIFLILFVFTICPWIYNVVPHLIQKVSFKINWIIFNFKLFFLTIVFIVD